MDEKCFVTSRHIRVRNGLRIAGPIAFGVGLGLTITGAASLFAGNLRLFFLTFIGLPLVFTGGSISMYGLMGAVARYTMTETAPSATDAFNYMADSTQAGVRKVARATAAGVREGLAEAAQKSCPRCNANNEADSKFCKSCGAPV
jgi:zinc-ribbon domain